MNFIRCSFFVGEFMCFGAINTCYVLGIVCLQT